MTSSKKVTPEEHYRFLVYLQNAYLRRRYFRKILPVVLTFAVAAICFYSYQGYYHGHYHDEETTIITVSVITAFVLSGLYPSRLEWLRSSTLYYEIEGSRDAQGKHRCIKCGGRGIWRKGQYKSNDVYCYCSKCQFGLWKE